MFASKISTDVDKNVGSDILFTAVKEIKTNKKYINVLNTLDYFINVDFQVKEK